MTEPDPDRGHIDRSAPDVVALVVPGGDGAVLAEMAEGALDHVALLIGRGVEGGRAAAPAAAPQPVPDLVRGLGDSGLDLAAAQVAADRRAGSAAAPGTAARSSAGPSAGRRPANRGAARRWSGGPAAGIPNLPAGGSCWSARPGTGPAPPGPVTPRRPWGAPGR